MLTTGLTLPANTFVDNVITYAAVKRCEMNLKSFSFANKLLYTIQNVIIQRFCTDITHSMHRVRHCFLFHSMTKLYRFKAPIGHCTTHFRVLANQNTAYMAPNERYRNKAPVSCMRKLRKRSGILRKLAR